MSGFYLSNPEDFDSKLKAIIADGKEHFHVITDFDSTLTKAFVDGKPRFSLLFLLEQWWYLGADFSVQSKKNFEKYHPMEVDPSLTLEQKKAAMLEWWIRQFAVMLKAGLTKDIIEQTMKSDAIGLRIWHEYFFDILKDNDIPLLIFSATGLWYESIYYCLRNEHKLSDTISIISNDFIRDEKGKAISIKEPIIHSYNKDETVIRELPIYEKIKDRKNVLLLWDSPGDAHMADGFDYKNIIKIWFLNHDTPENRKLFQEIFDLIILDDGSMYDVNNIIEKICG